MKENLLSVTLIVFLVSAMLTTAWNHYALLPTNVSPKAKTTPPKLSNSTSYCFHFTWMGGNFNNRTFKNIRNKTCSQYFKDKKTLCINPMVATFSGDEPDIPYILENHPLEATCRMNQDQVCVKYTVTNNGFTSYMTRYCTQVNIEYEDRMKSGCIQEKRGTQTVEVCACRSQPGPNGICNTAHHLHAFKPLLSVTILYKIYLMFLK